MFEPNDSPYGEFVRHFLKEGASALDCYGELDLDEYESITRCELGRPVYENDPTLLSLLAAIREHHILAEPYPERRPFVRAEFDAFCADPKNQALVERILQDL